MSTPSLSSFKNLLHMPNPIKARPMLKMPILSTSTKFSIWFTVALVVIIALLIVLILSSNAIRSNTNYTDNYIMQKMEAFNRITGKLLKKMI